MLSITTNMLKLGSMFGCGIQQLNRINTMACKYMPSRKEKVLEKAGLPAKPKRPVSIFARFIRMSYPEMAKKHPNKKPHELFRFISEEWNKIDPSILKNLQDQIEKEMVEYRSAMQAYDSQMSQEDKDAIEATVRGAKMSDSKKALKIKLSNLGMPKRPTNAYAIFLREEFASGPPSRMQIKDRVKIIASQWQSMAEDKKEMYRKQFKKQREEYQTAFDEWEKRMIREGKLEIAYDLPVGRKRKPTLPAES